MYLPKTKVAMYPILFLEYLLFEEDIQNAASANAYKLQSKHKAHMRQPNINFWMRSPFHSHLVPHLIHVQSFE